MQAAKKILSWALALLPDSPFTALANGPIQPYLKAVNWIVPVNFMISTMETWLVAIAVYYVVSALLRWAKAIS
jgi:hypothetical protein